MEASSFFESSQLKVSDHSSDNLSPAGEKNREFILFLLCELGVLCG